MAACVVTKLTLIKNLTLIISTRNETDKIELNRLKMVVVVVGWLLLLGSPTYRGDDRDQSGSILIVD